MENNSQLFTRAFFSVYKIKHFHGLFVFGDLKKKSVTVWVCVEILCDVLCLSRYRIWNCCVYFFFILSLPKTNRKLRTYNFSLKTILYLIAQAATQTVSQGAHGGGHIGGGHIPAHGGHISAHDVPIGGGHISGGGHGISGGSGNWKFLFIKLEVNY